MIIATTTIKNGLETTEPTLQSDHQKYFGGLFWVIKRNYQLRWNSGFLQQEKGLARTGIEPATQGFSVLPGHYHPLPLVASNQPRQPKSTGEFRLFP